MTEVEKQATNNDDTTITTTTTTDAAEPQANGTPAKKVIVKGVTGTVKWFNVKNGYGFISRNDKENEDVFVHQTAIARNNPNKAVRSVGDGETVEFDIVEGEKGNEAANVTGVGGEPVKGSQYAAEKRFYGNRRRGGGYHMRGRRDGRRPRLSRRDNYNTEEPGSAQDSGVEKIEQETPERPRRVNRRPYLRRYYQRPRGGGPPRGPRGPSQNNGENYNNEERGESNEIVNYGGDRPQGGGGQEGAPRRRQKRFTRRFWSRRPRRPRSDTEGSQSGADGDASGNDNAVNNQENREPRQRRQRRQGGGSAGGGGGGGGGFRVRRRGMGRRGPPRGSRGERSNRDGSAKGEKQEGKSDRKVGEVNSIGKDGANLEDKEESVSDSTILVEKSEEVK